MQISIKYKKKKILLKRRKNNQKKFNHNKNWISLFHK